MNRLIIVLMTGVLLTGCGVSLKPAQHGPTASPVIAYDVRPLLHPKKKFLGVVLTGAGKTKKPTDDFVKATGTRPNLLAYYADFKEDLQKQRVTSIWKERALPLIVWEPNKTPLDEITSGRRDQHIREWARNLRDLNIPVALSFGHEMNGYWYSWGTKHTTPAQYVEAYHRVHDLFFESGATNVIWIWSPNILTAKAMTLKPYWVGSTYADWIGPIGYYGWGNGEARTFAQVFGRTMTEIRTFTDKPFLIPETAVAAGPDKAAQINDLFQNIQLRKDIIGVVWFNLNKEKDWRVQSDPASLAAFRTATAHSIFAFNPQDP
jgi:mannan endo-1,4-beta-mannosidase